MGDSPECFPLMTVVCEDNVLVFIIGQKATYKFNSISRVIIHRSLTEIRIGSSGEVILLKGFASYVYVCYEYHGLCAHPEGKHWAILATDLGEHCVPVILHAKC